MAADVLELAGRGVDKGVGGVAGTAGQASSLHRYVAVVPIVEGKDLGVVLVPVHKIKVAGPFTELGPSGGQQDKE